MRTFALQRGIGMVTAIFLLVVLTSLGAAMVSVMSATHQGSALDIRGARAYQVARAGAEWGVYQARRVLLTTCPSTTTFAPPDGEGGFVVTVSCTMLSHTTATSAKVIRRFHVIATACSPSTVAAGCPNASDDPDYVQRVVDVRFGN